MGAGGRDGTACIDESPWERCDSALTLTGHGGSGATRLLRDDGAFLFAFPGMLLKLRTASFCAWIGCRTIFILNRKVCPE